MNEKAELFGSNNFFFGLKKSSTETLVAPVGSLCNQRWKNVRHGQYFDT